MSKLVWDKPAERTYETGVENAAIFLIKHGRYQNGVAWNGLTAVNEKPSGAEPTPLYADNIKYLNLMSREEFEATIEAFTFPSECRECLGESEIARGVFIRQQRRHGFGMVYKTRIGNDEVKDDAGYKIHILFNCFMKPNESNHSTVNDTPEAVTFSRDMYAEKQSVPNFEPSATVVLDSIKLSKAGFFNLLRFIENKIYGTESTNPSFMTLSEIIDSVPKAIYLRDDEDGAILDSDGNRIQSFVFD